MTTQRIPRVARTQPPAPRATWSDVFGPLAIVAVFIRLFQEGLASLTTVDTALGSLASLTGLLAWMYELYIHESWLLAATVGTITLIGVVIMSIREHRLPPMRRPQEVSELSAGEGCSGDDPSLTDRATKPGFLHSGCFGLDWVHLFLGWMRIRPVRD